MKKEALAVILAVVVVSAATAAIYSAYGRHGNVASATSSSSSAPPPTSCTTEFPEGLALKEPGNETRLFALLPGNTGLVCVTYTVEEGGSVQLPQTLQFSATVQAVRATYSTNPNGAGNVTSYSYKAAQGVAATASPASVGIQSGAESSANVTVVYSIVASKGSAGFYSLGFTGCNQLIPFAVTSDWQKVTVSDFSGFFTPASCITSPPVTTVRITGIADLNTTLLVGEA